MFEPKASYFFTFPRPLKYNTVVFFTTPNLLVRLAMIDDCEVIIFDWSTIRGDGPAN